MRNRKFVLSIAVLVVGATFVGLRGTAGGVTAAHEYNHVLQVVVDGRNALGTDGQRRAGDPDGFGTFSAVISGTKLCYGFQIVDIATPLAAHIHRGAPDENGEVVVPLRAMKVGSRCKEIPRDVADSLLEKPSDFYVNVHTKRFPNGAVRGQLAHPERN